MKNVDPEVYRIFYRIRDAWRRRRRCTGDNAEFLAWLLYLAERELSQPSVSSY